MSLLAIEVSLKVFIRWVAFTLICLIKLEFFNISCLALRLMILIKFICILLIESYSSILDRWASTETNLCAIDYLSPNFIQTYHIFMFMILIINKNVIWTFEDFRIVFIRLPSLIKGILSVISYLFQSSLVVSKALVSNAFIWAVQRSMLQCLHSLKILSFDLTLVVIKYKEAS